MSWPSKIPFRLSALFFAPLSPAFSSSLVNTPVSISLSCGPLCVSQSVTWANEMIFPLSPWFIFYFSSQHPSSSVLRRKIIRYKGTTISGTLYKHQEQFITLQRTWKLHFSWQNLAHFHPMLIVVSATLDIISDIIYIYLLTTHLSYFLPQQVYLIRRKEKRNTKTHQTLLSERVSNFQEESDAPLVFFFSWLFLSSFCAILKFDFNFQAQKERRERKQANLLKNPASAIRLVIKLTVLLKCLTVEHSWFTVHLLSEHIWLNHLTKIYSHKERAKSPS